MVKIDFNNIEAEYRAKHPPDFITHLNYVPCLNEISEGLSVKCKLRLKNKFEKSNYLAKKVTLIELTHKSLNEEHKTILKNPDYAEVCVPWIAVKAYYLLFNLFLIKKYLLSGRDSSFNSSHEGILKDLKRFIREKQLCFNKDLFNCVYKTSHIFNFNFESGYNIKLSDVELEDRFYQVLKKLSNYKLEEFKRKKVIKNFRKKEPEARDNFIKDSDINICEFFYWYRIKSNYRDLEFLDKDISSEQFSSFYENYFSLTKNFYDAFKDLINDLSQKRFRKKIL